MEKIKSKFNKSYFKEGFKKLFTFHSSLFTPIAASRQRGQVLFEILLAIAVLVGVVAVSVELSQVSLQSAKTAGERTQATNLAREVVEAMRAISAENWMNLYGVIKGNQYHPEIQNGAWILVAGAENIIINGETYTRYLMVDNVSRNQLTGDIELTYDISNNDPSTQKITAFVEKYNIPSISYFEYITRWRNGSPVQTDWSGGGGQVTNPSSGDSANFNNKYYSSDSYLDTVATVGNLSIANENGLIVYGQSGNNTPQWRSYSSGDIFELAGGTMSGAEGRHFVVRASPIKQEAIAGYVTSGGQLQIMCYDGNIWNNEWQATVGGTGTTRRFNIAYETNSGDVTVLYSTNIATTNEMAYRTKSGTSSCGSANWNAEINLDPLRTSGIVQWIEMAFDKRANSNLITAIWADGNSDLSAMIWSGDVWGNEPLAVLETSLEIVAAAQDINDFEVEYESVSGDVMVIWANSAGNNGTNGVRYATCAGGIAGCAWSAVNIPPTWSDDATNMDISANPNTNEIVFASIGNAGSDLQVGYWSGSAWSNQANADTSTQVPLANTKLVATGWLVSGVNSRSIVVYNDSGVKNIGWYIGNAGSFSKQGDWPSSSGVIFGDPQKWYDIQTDPLNKNRLIFTLSDVNNDLFAKRLTMDSSLNFNWSHSDNAYALETNLPNGSGSFSFAYWRLISKYRPFGELISSTFNTGSTNGAAFNSIFWKGTKPFGSRVKVQLATSDCLSGAIDYPNCTIGSWGVESYYIGGPTCSTSDWWELEPDTAQEVRCFSQLNNKRYFRYKARLESNPPNYDGAPMVEDVVINFSP